MLAYHAQTSGATLHRVVLPIKGELTGYHYQELNLKESNKANVTKQKVRSLTHGTMAENGLTIKQAAKTQDARKACLCLRCY